MILDLLVVGAGPVGIACGVEAVRLGLSHLLVEKGCLGNTILGWPTNTVFFSTPEFLEIGGVPFVCSGPKPTRRDGLVYYRKVAHGFGVKVKLYERVLGAERRGDGFGVTTDKATYECRRLVAATGFFDHPNLVGVPGEDLPKVTHYFKEPYPYAGTDVLVVGGKSSAVETALDLYRNGARVTLAVRKPSIGASVKYWLKPDLENRITEGSITAHFDTVVESIGETSVTLRKHDERFTIANDFVVLHTGFHPDFDFLRALGIAVTPEGHVGHDPETMETNVPGLYVAGVVAAGVDIGKLFIENGRHHAVAIARHVAASLGREVGAAASTPLTEPLRDSNAAASARSPKRFLDGD